MIDIRHSIEKYIKVKYLIKVIDEHLPNLRNLLPIPLIIQFSSLGLTGVKGVCDAHDKYFSSIKIH